MAAASLLALIDDIATVLDDLAVLTKVAAKKTAGVLGDDLALNAQQVTGMSADRELPVVWAVAKGSAVNKLILVPAALAISALAPWAVIPLLMIGGAYLCYEGFEKIAHGLLHSHQEDEAHHAEHVAAIVDPTVDLVALEKDKIKGAIRTDFVLSAEIVTITLGTVADKPFATQLGVLALISAIMTVGVYGLVAGIVRLDDVGLHLNKQAGARRMMGAAILRAAPILMKTLSILGTAAMFMVGGGILAHGIGPVHHWIEHVTHNLDHVGGIGGLLGVLVPVVLNALLGIIVGGLVVAVVMLASRLMPRSASAA